MDNPLLDLIEAEIVEVLREAEERASKEEWSDSTWTREIKSSIARIGNRCNYAVYASSIPEAKGGEWLFDMTWIEQNRKGGLLSIPLVLESEWGRSADAIDDFQKLLIARADRRVMALLHDSTAARVGALFQLLVQDTTAQDFGLPSSAIRLRM